MLNFLKRNIMIFIIILIVILFYPYTVNAEIPTLEQIVNSFNNCSKIKEFKEQNVDCIAQTNENTLKIITTTKNNKIITEFNLNNNILSTTGTSRDKIIAAILGDCIGQFHGYKEQELLPTLEADDIRKYTIENEGYEAKIIDKDTDKYSIKIDISKKVPLLDFSKMYIEIYDLCTFDTKKEFLQNNGTVSWNKGNVFCRKDGRDGKNILYIAEKGGLTECSYKSILSIIEVMFDSQEVREYFRKNYTDISKNKIFDGFKIETNLDSVLIDGEKWMEYAEYYNILKFMKITIDKDAIPENLDIIINDNEENNNEENNNEENNNQENNNPEQTGKTEEDGNKEDKIEDETIIKGDKLPNTGKNTINYLVIIIFISISLILFIKINKYKFI